MTGMFDLYISMDWSGSETENKRVNLRVVEANTENGEGLVVDPPNTRIGAKA